MIFWTSFGGNAGVPGKLASGFEIMPGAVGSLGVMVLLTEEAIRVGVVVMSGRLEATEGRRRGPVGSEENAGKPRADTRGGGGGNNSEDDPGIRDGEGWGGCNSEYYVEYSNGGGGA